MKRRSLFLICASLFFLLQSCVFSNQKITAEALRENVGNISNHEAFSDNVMISSQGTASTNAGIKMYELGGNIIDAAVAVSFAISVERPQSTGIGGGGFMMIHLADKNKTIAVDFREKAPLKAFEKMYQDKKGDVIEGKSTQGVLAGGVPGLVDGLIKIHEKYGSLPLATTIQPAIELAEKGFKVYPHLAYAIEEEKEVLMRFPSSVALFFDKAGQPLKEGAMFQQPDLARTLKEIAKHGRRGFYNGWVADALLKTQKKYQGIMTQKDLDQYNTVFRKPVAGRFKDYKILSMPPPSSGGTHVIEILNILENKNLKALGPKHPQAIHQTAAAMQLAYADRAKYLGDSDFVKVPVKGLTSKRYAAVLASNITNKAKKSEDVHAGPAPAYESSDTTHFTIMDKNGNVISSTQTINGFLGSGLVVEGAGYVLNNEMDDFSAKPGVANLFGLVGGKQNAIRPEKRPLSSMSPTIVFKNQEPILSVGTPSGSRIITCVVHTLLNYLEYEMALYPSVAALRYHHQWSPDKLFVEPPSFSPKTKEAIEDIGYDVEELDLGCRIQAVTKEKGKLHGVSDPRGVGLSLGI